MHESVDCARCGAHFECKVGNITQCQCQAVTLTDEDRRYIRTQYETCLCAKCLLALRNERKHLPWWLQVQQAFKQFGKR
ncbi:Cysteine-rich CWC [Chitinophaga costaii]|uniref:Cysteine-rich CWC n=1 Tax=Chitinophaga costaii TaxID=1335309 RepID=A0A1C4D525_9BACT|nr:cysteine-rich CWC family protein [Chitinophaga costaii]PUZ24459.1 hypothetical protein DCM91_11150 [Chitinophaga costaii]SCC26443.1 Cysteine-rich CWC [Chitinophaga costaii]